MPDEALHKIHTDGLYYHIYNCGVEKRIIFNDAKDYETFQAFLGEYLTPPPDKQRIKKTFTVNGRVFHGVPHQPKNYFQQAELVAYSLQPTRFHLLLQVKTSGALEKFMRSLSTRYSMYYNTKYQHAGSLFAGTYKSAEISTVSQLLTLTQYLHREPGYTSYQEFLGKRTSSWVKPSSVLTLFEQSKNSSYKGTTGYQNFVEHYSLKPQETEALARIILERVTRSPEVQPVMRPHITDQPDDEPTGVSRSRVPEFIAVVTVFVLLIAMGIKNIMATSDTQNASPTVLGIQIMQRPTK